MRPLPTTRYEVGIWTKAKINIDYCVELDGMIYSVPCALVGARVELRSTAAVVEILLGNERVAKPSTLLRAQGDGHHRRRASAQVAPAVRCLAAITHRRLGSQPGPRLWRNWSS